MRKLAFLSLLLACSHAGAVSLPFNGEIKRTLAHNGPTWGGCMVEFAGSPVRDSGLACGDFKWVTFDCAGEQWREGERMFDLALLAFSMNGRVRILATDDEQRDGYCVAERIDLLETNPTP